MGRRTGAALLGAALACAALPGVAHADVTDAAVAGQLQDSVAINSLWVVVAALLVIFMQAGFAFLEIGFSRAKNAGTVVAKILTNFSIAALAYYAVGFAFAFGNGDIIGTHGFLLRDYGDPQQAFGIMGLSDATIESKWLFQFSFCAVSLAIVWGTTLERIKFGVYILYAIIFAAFIYPIASHWVFGGGWLQANLGMQDFAGSTAVHLIGATGALAVLLQLGARRGKYGKDGQPRAIPGHSMPLFGLGVLILWLGWFGFNPGSTLNAMDGRFPEVAMVTMLAAAAGVLGSIVVARWKTGTIDIGMAGNGAIGALVAITAPSGYVEAWAAPVIGLIAGIIVPLGVYAIDRYIDDPVGALTAHGSVRRLGHARLRHLHVAAAGRVQRGRRPRPDLHRLLPPDRRAGPGHRRRVLVRLRALLRNLRDHQGDVRPSCDRRGGGRRTGHLRARHVRVSGAVHPGARAHRLQPRARLRAVA